ncbi:MAG: META and DUF4377 domain-containing protein [Burkholderiales bacterium]|nr:META and DUF4377 domain-containing protein [Burkholderiales bacterium]
MTAPYLSQHSRTLLLLAALVIAAPAFAAEQTLGRSLHDHSWTLKAGTDASGAAIDGLIVADHPFVLRFDGKRVSVSGGCNQMNGGWRLSESSRLEIGRLAATMKACEPALMNADTALAAVLAQPLDARIDAGATPTLHLTSTTGQALTLTGQPTLKSLYGAPTRIFLEVAPQTVPCHPGAGAPTQCLQVRERKYDQQGLRVGSPGEWRIFYDRIDGYTHTPGVRNVLRIDRYQRKQVPADASKYVYALDMVVESEVVNK